MTKYYRLADDLEDDFCTAEARIKTAMALVFGGEKLVGYKVPSGGNVYTACNIETKQVFLKAPDGADIIPFYVCVFAGTPIGKKESIAKERHWIEEECLPRGWNPAKWFWFSSGKSAASGIMRLKRTKG
mmetsp:Transcript_527/g.1239  ORF Transcript_527/g.1239 Transcript_527/m.1239 type:complete len:129 (+) Transcript_527:681-1067(+)